MAYGATYNFGQIVNAGINTLLKAEFTRDSIIYQPAFREQDIATRNEYYRWYENGSELLGSGTRFETRSYSYQFSYYYQYSGDQHRQKFDALVTNRWNQLYYLLLTNRSYEPASGYCWHNVQFDSVSEVIWGIDELENTDSVGHIDGIVSFWRTNQFPISEGAVIEGDIVLE